MSKFIQVTDIDGKQVLVNSDFIVKVSSVERPDATFLVISGSKLGMNVKESFDTVRDLLIK